MLASINCGKTVAESIDLLVAHAPVFHCTRRFTICTCSAAAGRSTVDRLTFRAVTLTLSFDQTWQSSTKAMLLVLSDASAKFPRRAWRRPDCAH
jgi:hypothetical protein